MTEDRWKRVQIAVGIGTCIVAGILLWARGIDRGMAPALAVLFITAAVVSWLTLRYGTVRQRHVGVIAALLGTMAAIAALLGLALSWH